MNIIQKTLFLPLMLVSSLAISGEQIITPTPASENVTVGQSVSVKVDYSTANPADNTLTGLGLRIHWDSTKLTFVNLTNQLATDLFATGAPQADSSNFDADPATDTFLNVAWTSFTGNWPNAALPIELYTANFTVTAGLTAGTSTAVKFSASSTAATYTLQATSATKTVPALVTVPNVVGQTKAAAQTTLTGLGLVVTTSNQSSPSVAAGKVISQAPVAGASVTAGSTINLVISTGPALITIPNVVGQTKAAAQTTLTGLGLVVTTSSQSSSSVAAGKVISQAPASGASVAAGSTVNLVISTGPASIAVPSVIGQAQATAQTTLTGLGLVVTTSSQSSPTVAAGNVISQAPAAGASVAPGSTVNLVISTGPTPVTTSGTQAIPTLV